MASETNMDGVTSGIAALDEVITGLRFGDNVVWQVDSLEDYSFFVVPFVGEAIRHGAGCVYLRFAPHPPIIKPRRGLVIKEVDPRHGFDSFTAEVHRVIKECAKKRFFVLDNLSALAEEWATDEMLANFFQVTCPFLRELDTVAYFALTRGQHAHNAVARVRDTTQVLIDVYRLNTRMYIHPLKVWDRYSPQMFLPHILTEKGWQPVFHSGEAAAVSASARKHPLRTAETSIAPWDSVYAKLMQHREAAEDSRNMTPEIQALRQEFSRMLIGDHPEFNRVADSYFTLEE